MNETTTIEVKRYWPFEHSVSNNFNRLKAKIFNLVEATITDTKQADAFKGLVRGFANDEFKICIEEMRYHAKEVGLIDKEQEAFPQTALPLESENH